MIDSPAPEADLPRRDSGMPLDTEQLSGINETERGSLTIMAVREPG